MLSLATARSLKKAGLLWKPALHDFFAIPDRGLDNRVFVIADMLAMAEHLHGLPAVTFHGTAEWALDYLMMAEAVWMPTEEQLRELLARRLADEPTGNGAAPVPMLRLAYAGEGYRCEIHSGSRPLAFEAADASEAYAAALLYLMRPS